MKKTYSNHNHTLCHPEAAAEGSGHKPTMSSRFFTTLRMTFCPLSSSDLTRGSTRVQALHASGYPIRSGMTLLFACLLMLAPSFGLAAWTEENCTNKGGQIVTVGGTTFCKSTSSMNWWSAYSWCQAMGGYMPAIVELCPEKKIVDITYIGSFTSAWSSTPQNTSQVWVVNNYGYMTTANRNSSFYAYCLKN